MRKISGYTAFDAGFQKSIYGKVKSDNKRADKKQVERSSLKVSSKQPELSQGAKDLLSELQKKYGDMDFFVADYSSDEEAQRYLSRGNKCSLHPCLRYFHIQQSLLLHLSLRDKEIPMLKQQITR